MTVVPGDAAAGRTCEWAVRREALFQRSQQAQRTCNRLLSQGRSRDAVRLLPSPTAAERLRLPDRPAVGHPDRRLCRVWLNGDHDTVSVSLTASVSPWVTY